MLSGFGNFLMVPIQFIALTRQQTHSLTIHVLINSALINKKARSTGRTNQPGHWKYMPLLRQMTDPCLLDTEEDNPWGKYSEILRSLLITHWRDARDPSTAKLNALYNM
jgi:hypothetical protein